jgi:hypothetical protein
MPAASEGTFAYFCCRTKVRRLAVREPPVLIMNCSFQPNQYAMEELEFDA